jgi:hypothetical protein
MIRSGLYQPFDPGEDRQFCVVPAGPSVPVEQLGFQAAEGRFGHGVVERISMVTTLMKLPRPDRL